MRSIRSRAAGVDVFPFRLLDFGPFAAVETVVEYEVLLLAGRLALALAALGRRVFGRLQLGDHRPAAALHRRQILELCVLEIDVGFARRFLFALVADEAVGLAGDSVAQLCRRGFGNRILLRGTRPAWTSRTTLVLDILFDFH